MSLARPTAFATLALLLLATACGNGNTGDPATTEFAAELGVDLGAMQKRESGLYVLDRVVGTGVEATAARFPSVRYTLWLPDGTKVDSNEGGRPFEFLLGGGVVIRGWEELANVTLLHVCGPWYDDQPIPEHVFTVPDSSVNLDKTWVRKK